MSLNQLTANYTDSEGDEDDDNMKDISISSDEPQLSENKESAKGTPASLESRGSGTNTPKKKIGRLVSYANEDDEEDESMLYKDDDIEESDEILNSEPMDTGTEDGDDDKSNDIRDLGVKLPLAPTGKCATKLQDKVTHFVNRVKAGNMDWNRKIQNNKAFRNPSIYEKLIHHLSLDEMGSNYPLEMFDPHCWGKESYYEELSRVQKEEMDRREKERKTKGHHNPTGLRDQALRRRGIGAPTPCIQNSPPKKRDTELKVDIISGTKKPTEEEAAKKRKSRFDQAASGATVVGGMKNAVPPPTLTTVPSGNKTTINAFGTLKKAK